LPDIHAPDLTIYRRYIGESQNTTFHEIFRPEIQDTPYEIDLDKGCVIVAKLLFSLVALIAAAISSHSSAFGNEYRPDAAVLIKHCWSVSEKSRASGVTSDMRRGGNNTAQCLQHEIVKHASMLIDDGAMTSEDIAQLLNQLSKSYGKLYWSMYNENKACKPSCGTMYRTFHISALTTLYENILKDIISQLNEN
jgi:hypothetical protein